MMMILFLIISNDYDEINITHKFKCVNKLLRKPFYVGKKTS